VKGGEETSSGGVRHGEDHSRVKRNGTESNPIDTRITLFNKPRSGHALNTLDRKQDKIARPSGISDHDRVLIHTNTSRCEECDWAARPSGEGQRQGLGQKKS
jgi:hypothetical protein